MATENKYGKITTEHGSIGEDEPVFLLRAQDAAAVAAIGAYRRFCTELGSPQEHLDGIDAAITTFVTWQGRNPAAVKTPGTGG